MTRVVADDALGGADCGAAPDLNIRPRYEGRASSSPPLLGIFSALKQLITSSSAKQSSSAKEAEESARTADAWLKSLLQSTGFPLHGLIPRRTGPCKSPPSLSLEAPSVSLGLALKCAEYRLGRCTIGRPHSLTPTSRSPWLAGPPWARLGPLSTLGLPDPADHRASTRAGWLPIDRVGVGGEEGRNCPPAAVRNSRQTHKGGT